MARGGPPKPMNTRNGVYVESTIWTASSTECSMARGGPPKGMKAAQPVWGRPSGLPPGFRRAWSFTSASVAPAICRRRSGQPRLRQSGHSFLDSLGEPRYPFLSYLGEIARIAAR